ncbi:MAG: hypothetical protein LBC99_00050 [Spirochaetota bacterium]|jgi:hypothetical protein|nr:hypothetical protein [Spirochaetota bacterium]
MQENAKRALLLALFDALDEKDKDIVTAMMQSLVEKYGSNIHNNCNCISRK